MASRSTAHRSGNRSAEVEAHLPPASSEGRWASTWGSLRRSVLRLGWGSAGTGRPARASRRAQPSARLCLTLSAQAGRWLASCPSRKKAGASTRRALPRVAKGMQDTDLPPILVVDDNHDNAEI